MSASPNLSSAGTGETLYTVSEIANICGVSEKTIRTIIKRVDIDFHSSAIVGRNKTRLYSENALKAIQVQLGKNQLNQGKNPSTGKRAVAAVVSQQNGISTEQLVQIVAQAVSAAMTAINEQNNQRLNAIEQRMEERRALLPAPQFSSRASVIRIVNEHVRASGIDYQSAWGELYREFYYRMGIDARRRAHNQGIKTIDWIDDNGYMGVLESIAVDTFCRALSPAGVDYYRAKLATPGWLASAVAGTADRIMEGC